MVRYVVTQYTKRYARHLVIHYVYDQYTESSWISQISVVCDHTVRIVSRKLAISMDYVLQYCIEAKQCCCESSSEKAMHRRVHCNVARPLSVKEEKSSTWAYIMEECKAKWMPSSVQHSLLPPEMRYSILARRGAMSE